MLRITTAPRDGWRQIVESQGLLFHSIGGEPYWDEESYYLFEAAEVDQVEQATLRLDAMCLEAVEHVVSQGRLGDLGIPEAFHDFVAQSWERDEHTIYGRFDLAYDGLGPPRLLEYNADTPTSLLEASVVQWFWFRDLIASAGAPGGFDQFNSIHERLIEAWGRVGRELGPRVTFSSLDGVIEDEMTASYLRDTAIQAGLQTQSIPVQQIGWQAARRTFTDLRERPLEILFKLYPWEWMLAEAFGRNLPLAQTRFLEPPWKMALSSKAILVVLHELFPDSPYLLAADFEPFGDTYVAKPVHSREGANVAIVEDGQVVQQTDGEYGGGAMVYQEYCPLPEFAGRYPVVGSWMVNGNACGVGIREDDGPITRNTSRFLPHIFRKSTGDKPPAMGPKPSGATREPDPLWDRWLDR